MVCPDVNPGAGRLDRMSELVVSLHLLRAKAASYERRVNEMLVVGLNAGEDPRAMRDATGLTYDEMLEAEDNAFRARLTDSARLRLLPLVGPSPRYGEVTSRGDRGLLSGDYGGASRFN